MFQTDQPTASSTLPTPIAAGTQGYFTNGNPSTGVAATILDADFMNMVMMELVNVVSAGGQTPSKTSYNQVITAIKSMFSPVVGSVRNVSAQLAAAAASFTLTADEIVVETALGGQTYRITNFSNTINLATTGAGGMDTGTAPANGFIGIYAIYNPTTGASALLATNATSAVVPAVYGGAYMPAGYAASALVSVVPTSSTAGQFQIFTQADRVVTIPNVSIFSTSATAANPTIVNNLAVPLNAKFCSGWMQAGSSAAGAIGMGLYATNSTLSVGAKTMAVTITAGASLAVPFERLRITTGQRTFYTGSSGGGTSSFAATINQYEF